MGMKGNTDIFTDRQGPDESFVENLVLNETGHKNMLHLIHLRWFAVAGQIATIAIAALLLGIELPVVNMATVLVLLIAFNIGSHLRWHEESIASNQALFMALLVDVSSLSAQLYLSGGINNPFAFLFLLQVILSAILLRPGTAWLMVFITGFCLAVLSVFNQPLVLPHNSTQMWLNLYVQGLLVCFALVAALLVFFITRISTNLRAGDAQLASLRQRAAEEEHIVRMGLLASGAAHELGTPLATMSVILGDWKRMPAFRHEPGFQEEMEEMQSQLLRCKGIVSGILLSAGEARGESSSRTTLENFMDELVDEWQSSRNVAAFDYEYQIKDSLTVVSDSTVKQMIFNVLDNAVEASAQWVGFDVSREGQAIVMRIQDNGPGFEPSILEEFGKPYNSSKQKPGRGLGLFLVVNVARTLGGSAKAYNRKEGGAMIVLTIPLGSIALPQEAPDVG